MDVVTGTSEDLFLLQYPLRPRYRPYGDQGSLKSASISGEHLSLTYKLNTNNINYDRANNEFKQEAQSLLGSAIVPINKYCLGFVKDNVFSILPLSKLFQMRPSTSHLDSVLDQRQIEDVEELALLKQEKESKKMRVFKRKEAKESAQDAPALSLTCFDMFSAESKSALKALSVDPGPGPQFLSASSYFDQILPSPVKNAAFVDRIRALPVVLAVEELLKQVNLLTTEEAAEVFPHEKNIENVLFQKAAVVQGRWVRRSEVLREPLERDLCLLILNRRHKVTRKE